MVPPSASVRSWKPKHDAKVGVPTAIHDVTQRSHRAADPRERVEDAVVPRAAEEHRAGRGHLVGPRRAGEEVHHGDGVACDAQRGREARDLEVADRVRDVAGLEEEVRDAHGPVVADAPGPTYIRWYFGPLPPSRGVQRGPTTSVALQSTQFCALTTSLSPWR
jgi:hypothetical protein